MQTSEPTRSSSPLEGTQHVPSCSYASEQELVDTFVACLSDASPWGELSTRPEFFYVRGCADVVAIDREGRVLAFEAKLSKWRQAMDQAYRNTCFAHRSYVVLPKEAAMRAWRAGTDFGRRNVGICFVEGGITILQDANEVCPLQPWLSAKAAEHVAQKQDRDAGTGPF